MSTRVVVFFNDSETLHDGHVPSYGDGGRYHSDGAGRYIEVAVAQGSQNLLM
jgi:hypothetical protein